MYLTMYLTIYLTIYLTNYLTIYLMNYLTNYLTNYLMIYLTNSPWGTGRRIWGCGTGRRIWTRFPFKVKGRGRSCVPFPRAKESRSSRKSQLRQHQLLTSQLRLARNANETKRFPG